ncbi:MarR family winged helix-turn-helix transcriptional regulator [Paenibacillus sp.]|uniref:MarR family winged helix-turn-helix transcriptional regulator n=1 Tax=Paenibacillus sp. TaxID=58172 RepID=UPI002D59AC35|nr:MarR family transcriptional regulator [Paenibacillus sp.]HZG83364.1 MarR family transcriptional regulator [Paenibacillus sp.]
MHLPKAVGFEIKVLSNLIKRNLDEASSEEGQDSLTGMQGWVIGYVLANANREVFQKDIEKDFNIRRATVTGVLQLMERNGLIIRESVAYDARLKKITLTPKALELHERNVQRFLDFEAKLTRGLSEEEIELFYAIAEKLKKNLE